MTILGFAIPILVFKLFLAARTYGTNDIAHWGDFVRGEALAGPAGMYGLNFDVPNHSFYNHPPLIGYYLAFLNWVQGVGIPYRFTLRAVSSVADVGSALLVFELLRRRTAGLRALISGILVAVSPVLIMVSGYHGNTDPVFCFFVLLGLYLLVDRRLPAWAGAAIAIAVGVKIVPMVVIPALAVFAYKRGPKELLRCAAGFVVVFALTWTAALVEHFSVVRLNVLGYGGVGRSPWGIVQIGHWLGDPAWVGTFTGSGRSVVVIICALVPAVAVWRRPGVIVPAVAWSLVGFLALAPSYGVQYMVWPLAAGYLIGLGWGTAYNIGASVVLFLVYDRWSGGLPWYRANATYVWAHSEVVTMMITWVVLMAVLVRGAIKIFPRTQDRMSVEAAGWLPTGRGRGEIGPGTGRPSGKIAAGTTSEVHERTSSGTQEG